ncbi:MerR family transcriptional regulator [Mucilaginibacter sp. RS28]|uniref:MerR family transcriptional regulator n=1 Tax=Mucilaginibacter straminoryzae TaxID=2932774 RepID=A0A9X1X5N1_9SPHI|nr:MerR family transcriptional regulator [Mucilaginibacter straminoryzae]MCJ8210058.1 MerR family transcriptional regulator [Mucilaginibacter straminoryzae]
MIKDNQQLYTVQQLSAMARISVRTLHVYDQKGLLKPLTRTSSGYRVYGDKELLRLQQILLYKAMDLPLEKIGTILQSPDFETISALEAHQHYLEAEVDRLKAALRTIKTTIEHLKKGDTMEPESLYKGLSKEEAKAIRNEAAEKYGEENIAYAEQSLMKLSKADLQGLKDEQQQIMNALFELMSEAPECPAVQFEIARHYQNIRRFWGTENFADKQADAYEGLGKLYVADERFYQNKYENGEQFVLFLQKAISYYTNTKLR